jgi:uncharacterized membrane protein
MARRALFLQLNRISPWKIALAGAGAALLLVGILAVAIAAFVVILPIVLIVAGIGGWWATRQMRAKPAKKKRQSGATVRRATRVANKDQPSKHNRINVVDAEYIVLDPGTPEKSSKDTSGHAN